MVIYIRELVKKLDKDRPIWRLDTVITMDNDHIMWQQEQWLYLRLYRFQSCS